MSKKFWSKAAWFWAICIPLAFGSGVSSVSNYNPSAVAITGGTITGITGASTFAGGNVTWGAGGLVSTTNAFNITGAASSYRINNNILISGTAPTIASGFGTGPSIPAGSLNGTASFNLVIGTGGTATTGTITMPPARNEWECYVIPRGAPQANQITYSQPNGSTSIILNSIAVSTGAAFAWTASTSLAISCIGN